MIKDLLGLGRRLSVLESRVENLENDVGSLSDKANTKSLNEQLPKIQKSIDSLRNEVISLKRNGEKKSDDGQSRNELEFENKLETQSKEISTMQQTINELKSKINIHQNKSVDISPSQPGIETVLENKLKEQSTEISTKLDNIVDAIKKTNVELVAMLTQPRNLSSSELAIPTFETLQVGQAIKKATVSKVSITDGFGEQSGMTRESLEAAGNKKNLVRGSAQNNPGGLAAAEKCKWFYASNFKSETTTEQVTKYLQSQDISVYVCEKLSSKNAYVASFKISVNPTDEKHILNEELWPTDIVVKPFVFKNNNNGGQQRSSFFHQSKQPGNRPQWRK